MPPITTQMVEKSYEIAIEVYKKQFDKNHGASLLDKQYNMNNNSALMYIGNINYMLDGQGYKRSMAEDHTRYFLTMIKNDFGIEILEKALHAVKQHVLYIHSIKKPSNVEKLYNEFMKNHNFSGNVVIKTEPIYFEDKDTEDSDIISVIPQNFIYEKDLQNSLVRQAEELFSGYKIYGDNLDGIEYQIEGKRIDLLLENDIENKLLAIELKSSIADFKVYGQISMYLTLLNNQFPDKIIEGVIIAGEIDSTLKMAAQRDKTVKLKSYKISLDLIDE